MKIEVNIKKWHVFVLLGAFLVLAAGVFAYAYNSSPSNPAVFGHSVNEIDWTAKVPNMIVGTLATDAVTENSKKLCKADGTDCPSGRLLGGGQSIYSGGRVICTSSWGTGICQQGTFGTGSCSSGSIVQLNYLYASSGGTFLCIL